MDDYRETVELAWIFFHDKGSRHSSNEHQSPGMHCTDYLLGLSQFHNLMDLEGIFEVLDPPGSDLRIKSPFFSTFIVTNA